MTDPDTATVHQGAPERWVDRGPTSLRFWASSPSWRGDVARAEVDGQTVVWSDAGVFGLGVGASAVARFLDGHVILAVLADDLAAAAEVPVEEARAVVGSVVRQLVGSSAVEGWWPEPATAAPVTTRPPFGPAPDPHALAAAQALAGERSVAEIMAPDSCVGARLRNHSDVPLVSRRGVDGRVRSVRCHDPRVAERLTTLFGGDLATGASGPIEVFVVTPLEGDGPARIFDGWVGRRGRPRSPDAAAAVVDQVLGERESVALAATHPRSAPVPLGMFLVVGPDGEGHLVPPDAVHGPGLVHRLESAGFRPTWGRALLHRDGCVSAPGTSPRAVAAGAVRVHAPTAPDGAAQRIGLLLGDAALPTMPISGAVDAGTRRRSQLPRVVELAARARWSTIDGGLGVHLGVDAPT